MSRGRNKVSRGRKGQVEVENDLVGPGRGGKYRPVPTPKWLHSISVFDLYVLSIQPQTESFYHNFTAQRFVVKMI